MSDPDRPLAPTVGTGSLSAEILARVDRALPPGASICVAFSGGLDSTVMLDILSDDAVLARRKVTALHVNHGLSPNAEQWVKFCERFCANHGVPLTVEYVRVDPGSPLGIEAAARLARYAVYSARTESFLALAHHLDDQAETVLLQLLRGTGLKGIAAMPELRPLRGTGVQVFRPLLDIPRARLLEHAQDRGLRWIEDESNASPRHDRNYLRHEIGPLLDQRYPGWREAVSRFARHAGSAGELLDDLATLDGVPVRPGDPMPIRHELSEERRANALRAFLARNAVAMPSEARLAEMSRQLYEAREDARVRIDHAGVSIVRHRGGVLVERDLEPPSVAAPRGMRSWRVEWRAGEGAVDLGNDRGQVLFEPVRGAGISRKRVTAGDWYFAPRSGGESLRLATDRPTRTLKNLLQEGDVAAWQRDRLPLLFHGERLVWVPGVGIAAEYACEPGEEGVRPSWAVAGKAPLC
ncbi:MAG TPA: tRNA lysidine(34) synthetase TilS [Usitatibacter sp.]|nr:tRNA lysidine(34) synthetase TilS [Usitatibacter sp.]